MKKVITLTALLVLLTSFGQMTVKGENDAAIDKLIVKEDSYLGADFSSGIFTYELEKKFVKSPNTMEAWLRLGDLPRGEAGGVIFGNFETYNYNGVKLEVDKDRHISLNWNNNQVVITFKEYVLANDEWTHVSVVRDEANNYFSLYINGNLAQKVKRNAGTDAISDYRYIVGGDWSNWRAAKNVFKGEIGQITAYSKALDSKSIYQDYIYGDKISNKTRENLLFNADFTINCKGAIDTSSNNNNAKIRSNDYLYDGEIYDPKDYSFAIIPDPQIMTHWVQGNLPSISEYIIEKNKKHNVALSLCVGDNADGSLSWDYELSAIKNEYDKLKNAGIRWVTTPGNHDYDDNAANGRGLTNYNRYFSYDEISKFDYFGGVYKSGQTQNAYYEFEVSGVNYLIISLEFGADNSMLEWANDVVEEYPDHRVIVYTHAYIGGDGERLVDGKAHSPRTYGYAQKVEVNNADAYFDKFIKKHENIFMVFCGHVPSDDIIVREDVGDHGNTIMQFLIDAQGVMGSGGESILSMVQFDELEQKVYVNFVSTTLNKLYNIQNQFELSFEGKTDILSSVYYDEDGNIKDEYL